MLVRNAGTALRLDARPPGPPPAPRRRGAAPRPARITFRSVLRGLRNAAGILLITLVLLELTLRALGLVASWNAGSPGKGDASEYTILCLGDSWTFGLGAHSYGATLESRLNEASADGRTYRVVRSGIPGSNSSQGLDRLRRHLYEQRFDMLIVLIGNNDHQNLAESEYWKFAKQPGRIEQWGARARVFTHSLRIYKLYRTVKLRLSGRPTPDEYFVAESEEKVAVPKETVIALGPHRRQLEHNLTEIVDLARIHDVELVFMTYFYFHGYEVNESILDVAAAHGVPIVNNTMLFHDRVPAEKRGEYYQGAHPTGRGQDFIAANILETVAFE